MTKEYLIILDELATKEWKRTLTTAEAETLDELRREFRSEMDDCRSQGPEVLLAKFKEYSAIWTELSEDKYLVMAGELMLAGWTSEEANPRPGHEAQTMSLYWRRPPRRKGSKEMLFRSTDQAYRHMQKGNE